MLASASLAAATDTLLYTVPAQTKTAASVFLSCRDGSALVRIAITPGTTPGNAHYIEYDTPLVAGSDGSLERSGLLLNAADRIYARSSAATVSAVVLGVEEAV